MSYGLDYQSATIDTLDLALVEKTAKDAQGREGLATTGVARELLAKWRDEKRAGTLRMADEAARALEAAPGPRTRQSPR